MKYFIVEPTYKKSFVEYTLFHQKDEEGKTTSLRKELGWRWGSFMFSVPETEEEAYSYIKECGYDNLLDYASDYGFTILDENKKEILDPEANVIEIVSGQLLPEESDSFVDITEDYPNAEFVDSWDGCWEHWEVFSYQKEISEDEQQSIIEEVEEAYSEEYEEGVENLGWEFVSSYFEMHCSPKITPCDENGKPLTENNDLQ